jgi:hypothetical protein
MPVLENEIKFLESHRKALQAQYGEKYLIIVGDQVTGAFDTIEEALQSAGATHGLKNVLIRQASEAELEFSAPALTLGILNADSSRATGGTTKNS